MFTVFIAGINSVKEERVYNFDNYDFAFNRES